MSQPFRVPTDHPQATTVLVLGILSLVVCGLLAPFAWVMGNRVVGEIDDRPDYYGGRSAANAGRIMGMIVCWIFIITVVVVLLVLVLALAVGTS